MGKRRMTCGSGNTPTEYQEGNCNGRRREAHKRSRFFLSVLCISLVLVIPNWSSAENDKDPCLPHCWKSEPGDVKFNDGLFMKQVDREKQCKDLCVNNETCIGVYWGFNPVLKLVSCWFQMPNTVVSESLTNATHWTLSDCTDDCLPYCWKEKWTHIQVMGGALQNNVDTENECKVVCANDQGCNGADWNMTDRTCWLLFMSPITHVTAPDPVHHWEIQRNLSTTCSKAGSTAVIPGPENTLLPTGETGETASTLLTTAETSENATNTTEFAETTTLGSKAIMEVTTENTSAFISFEPTNATNNTQAVPIPINDHKAPTHRGRGPAEVGESRGKGRPPIAASSDADCDCPDFLTGILVMAAMMAVSVLIIIGLIAFIISNLRAQQEAEAEPEGKPDSLYGFRSSYHGDENTPEPSSSTPYFRDSQEDLNL